MDTDAIKLEFRDAVKEFIHRDKYDLLHVNTNEMTLSHRIAVYMERGFPGYNVDCEYSKHHDGSTKTAGERKVRPDIIVHHRGNTDALLIIEIKKAGHGSRRADKEIKKLTSMIQTLGYSLGAYVGILKSHTDLVWVNQDGSLLHEEI